MEGKTVILSVLIMSLVMAQIQVEAATICCPSHKARIDYSNCRHWYRENTCVKSAKCIYTDGNCPSGYPDVDSLENSGDAVNEYCKLGCAFSMCSSLTNLQKSEDASEIVTGAVEKCAKACSTFCTKGSKLALETA